MAKADDPNDNTDGNKIARTALRELVDFDWRGPTREPKWAARKNPPQGTPNAYKHDAWELLVDFAGGDLALPPGVALRDVFAAMLAKMQRGERSYDWRRYAAYKGYVFQRLGQILDAIVVKDATQLAINVLLFGLAAYVDPTTANAAVAAGKPAKEPPAV